MFFVILRQVRSYQLIKSKRIYLFYELGQISLSISRVDRTFRNFSYYSEFESEEVRPYNDDCKINGFGKPYDEVNAPMFCPFWNHNSFFQLTVKVDQPIIDDTELEIKCPYSSNSQCENILKLYLLYARVIL